MQRSSAASRCTAIPVFLVCLLLLAIPAAAGIGTIPQGGAIFIGEENLDITQSGATTGASLVWYGTAGKISNAPAAQVTVGDPEAFYASPATFSGKTGPWFLLPDNSLAFYIKEPTLAIRVVDYSSDFVISPAASWVPKGDTVGFRIDTNLWEMSQRPGSTGAPLDIRLTGPGEIRFSSLGGYSLDDISVSSIPFETGPVWSTGSPEYPAGEYTVSVRCDANDMSDNYPVAGTTISEEVTFLVQKDNPLITHATTVPVETTISPTSIASPPGPPAQSPVTTVSTTAETTPATPSIKPSTLTPTTVPGFLGIPALVGLGTGILLICMRRRMH